jgi:DNA polymerase III epsilon subunit-like protein
MNDRLLVLDTETGGLDSSRFSILSLGAVIWDKGALGQEIDLPIAEMSLVTDPQSLAINQIDPQRHLLTAIPVDQAIARFIGYLKDNFPALAHGEKITLVGHNVTFDIGFLRRFFRLGNMRFEDYFSHRTVDTATILKFLMLAGRVNLDSPSSTAAFNYFGVKISQRQRHTALADARATAELLNAMLTLIKAP